MEDSKLKTFKFSEREPEVSSHIVMFWEDGSECECLYMGLDKTLTPLPTHWYYVH